MSASRDARRAAYMYGRHKCGFNVADAFMCLSLLPAPLHLQHQLDKTGRGLHWVTNPSTLLSLGRINREA